MYEALALAIEMNKRRGPRTSRRRSTTRPTSAERTPQPEPPGQRRRPAAPPGLLRPGRPAARPGGRQVPHRAEPLMMSINLAQKTKDPKRMADVVERLLSLGWPGNDEYFRRDARKQAETLAEDPPRGGPGRRGRRPARPAPRGRGPRPLRPPDLGRRRRLRPRRRRTPGRDRQLPDAPDGLRRLDRQERLRQASRGGLRLPPRLRRRLHGPDQHDLQQPQEARRPG